MAKELWSLAAVVGVALLAQSGFRHLSESRDAERLVALARPGDIRMISSETCPWCTVARRWMQAEGVPFEECLIERDTACADEFRARGGLGTPLLVVRGRSVLGFDRGAVLEALEPSP
jgi:glutaredoxin